MTRIAAAFQRIDQLYHDLENVSVSYSFWKGRVYTIPRLEGRIVERDFTIHELAREVNCNICRYLTSINRYELHPTPLPLTYSPILGNRLADKETVKNFFTHLEDVIAADKELERRIIEAGNRFQRKIEQLNTYDSFYASNPTLLMRIAIWVHRYFEDTPQRISIQFAIIEPLKYWLKAIDERIHNTFIERKWIPGNKAREALDLFPQFPVNIDIPGNITAIFHNEAEKENYTRFFSSLNYRPYSWQWFNRGIDPYNGYQEILSDLEAIYVNKATELFYRAQMARIFEKPGYEDCPYSHRDDGFGHLERLIEKIESEFAEVKDRIVSRQREIRVQRELEAARRAADEEALREQVRERVREGIEMQNWQRLLPVNRLPFLVPQLTEEENAVMKEYDATRPDRVRSLAEIIDRVTSLNASFLHIGSPKRRFLQEYIPHLRRLKLHWHPDKACQKRQDASVVLVCRKVTSFLNSIQ